MTRIKQIHPLLAAWTSLACLLGLAGCLTTTPSTNPGVSADTAQFEKSLLAQQADAIQQRIPSTPSNAPVSTIGAEDTIIRTGDQLVFQAWLADNTAQLSGYPMEAQVPESGALFLPHFGLMIVAGKSATSLQTSLFNQHNESLSAHPVAAPTTSIQPGQTLTIQVWLKNKISQLEGFPLTVKVADSGDIFVLQVGNLPVTGLSVPSLQARLATEFAKILNEPNVIVLRSSEATADPNMKQALGCVIITRKGASVQMQSGDSKSMAEIGKHFIMLGHIGRPGLYPLTPGLQIRDAVALAGGFQRYANETLFLVRGEGSHPTVMRINVNAMLSGKNLEQNVTLMPKDAIYVAPKSLWKVADFISMLLLPVMQLRDAMFVYDRFSQ